MSSPKGKAENQEKKKKSQSSKTLLSVFNSRKVSLVKLGLDGFQMQIPRLL